MKKLLLTSAAVCGLALAAAPAHADVDLEIGGYAKMYGAAVDHDEVAGGVEGNDFDIIRDTEIHLTGSTTLDNGLTVGAHLEMEADNGPGSNGTSEDDFAVEESYLFFSGNWGRVNLGAEDGAAYLLQVAAPSADANIDGIRQYVNPVNANVLTNGAMAAGSDFAIDYDQGITGKADKITYMTPIYNGFQLGATYSPDSDAADDNEGIGTDAVQNAFGAAYEIAVRYEGQFDQVGVIVGAGFSQQELEAVDTAPAVANNDPADDRTQWNVGLDLDIGPFGVGAIYTEDDRGEIARVVTGTSITDTVDAEETFAIGVDYTSGNYKFGASYIDTDNYLGFDELEASRYTAGVTYTYGPGMTFSGSIGQVELENANVSTATNGLGFSQESADATYITVGTQVNF